MFKQLQEANIDKNQSHITQITKEFLNKIKMDRGCTKKIADTIPKPLFANHEEALKWSNRRLSQYAEIRSVALILKSETPNREPETENGVWSLNIKSGNIHPDADNISEFTNTIKALIQEDAVIIKVEPMVIWLPNAVKHIWSIQLIQPNQIP